MRTLLAHRDARISIAGQAVSTFGDTVLWLALGIWIKMLTGSTSAAGLSFFAFTLGLVCSPVGAVVVDRVRRRPLLIGLNLAAALLVLPLLLVHDRQQVWLIYLVMLGYGLITGVIGGGQTALTQTIVPAELLGEANGLLQTLTQGMRLVTPLIGASALTAFGAAPLVIGDAVTFVITAALLGALRVREDRPAPSGERLPRQMVAGLRHIGATPVLRQFTVATVLAIIAFGLSESVLFAVVADGLHRPPAFLGVLSSAQGTGALLAGAAAAPLMRRTGEGVLTALGLAAAGAGFLLLATSDLAAAFAGCAVIGAGLPWIIVGLMTAFQRRTPPELMGRTDSALGVLISAPQTVAIAVGAGLVAVVDFRLLLAAMAVLVIAAAAYLCTRPEQRRPQPRPPEPSLPEQSPPEQRPAGTAPVR